MLYRRHIEWFINIEHMTHASSQELYEVISILIFLIVVIVIFIIPLYKWGNQATERLNKLPGSLGQWVADLKYEPRKSKPRAHMLITSLFFPECKIHLKSSYSNEPTYYIPNTNKSNSMKGRKITNWNMNSIQMELVWQRF